MYLNSTRIFSFLCIFTDFSEVAKPIGMILFISCEAYSSVDPVKKLCQFGHRKLFFFFQKNFIISPIIYFIYVRRFLQNGLTNQDNFFCNLWGMFSRWSSYKTFLHLFFVNYIFYKNPMFMYVRLLRIGLNYRNRTFCIL